MELFLSVFIHKPQKNTPPVTLWEKKIGKKKGKRKKWTWVMRIRWLAEEPELHVWHHNGLTNPLTTQSMTAPFNSTQCKRHCIDILAQAFFSFISVYFLISGEKKNTDKIHHFIPHTITKYVFIKINSINQYLVNKYYFDVVALALLGEASWELSIWLR